MNKSQEILFYKSSIVTIESDILKNERKESTSDLQEEIESDKNTLRKFKSLLAKLDDSYNIENAYKIRLNILKSAYDMACHNLLCYSKTYGMNTPKEGYNVQWQIEKTKVDVLEVWLKELEIFDCEVE
jgi:hypothetical protein